MRIALLLKMARNGEPVHCLQLDVVNAFGERVRINAQPVVIPGSRRSEFTLLQILTLHRSATATAPDFSRELSNREREVLDLLFSGADTEQIAGSLSIAVATARTHIQNLLRRLQVHSRAEAVAFGTPRRISLSAPFISLHQMHQETTAYAVVRYKNAVSLRNFALIHNALRVR